MPTWSKAVGLLFLLVSASTRTAWAQERELQLISDDLDAIGKQIADVSQADLQAATGSDRSYARVFDHAETFFLLGDYARAGLLLYPLLQNSASRTQPTYEKALYYLGVSEYHIGNDMAARATLLQVAARGEAHADEALQTLILLGDRSFDWTGIDAALATRRVRGALPTDLAYLYAKSLLLQRRPQAVASVIADVPRNHHMYAKARYLVGVASVESRDYVNADAVFNELRTVGDTYDDAQYVRDICTLNRGRLLLEKGQSEDAVNAYNEVPRQSKLFDDALYETIWTYLRQADDAKEEADRTARYANALQSLEIFLLSDEHPEMEPEARILMGNILSRLGQVDEAQQVFLDIVARYTPIRDQVAGIKSTVTDPVPLFVPHGPNDLAEVSPLVAVYAAGETRLKRALDVSNDLNDSEQWLKDSKEVLAKLWAALDSGGTLSFFPGLRDLVFHKLTLENELVRMMARLVDVEAGIVADSLDATQSQAFKTLQAQRDALEKQRKGAPQSQDDYENVVAANVEKVAGVEKEITKLHWMIEEQRRTVAALHTWLLDNPGSLDPASRSTLEAQMKTHNDVTEQLETARQELLQTLAAQRSAVTSGVEDPRLGVLRGKYAAVLNQERELLDAGRARAPADARTNFARIDLQRSKISAAFQGLDAVERKVSETLAQRTLESKADLLALQREIEQRKQDLATTREGASGIVQDIAVHSLQNVQNRLNEIVMRGDVGLVDVAWQLKEEETREISRRVNAQHNELEILDNEYKEVLAKDSKETKEKVR